MNDAYDYCEALVRERDRERFIAALFAPSSKRQDLFALHALDLELAHVAEVVREPMAGEIRLQWWREALDGKREEEAKANPVGAAILATIVRYDLPRELLLTFVDVRSRALDSVSFETLEDMIAYADATAGATSALASAILGGKSSSYAQAALYAGRALTIANLLRTFAHDVSKGHLRIPLELLATHGVHTASVSAGDNSEGLRAALRELRRRALEEHARLQSMDVPPEILPAFLTASLVPARLAPMSLNAYDPFRTALELSKLRAQFMIWRAARRGLV
ncbi:MAG: squalene/phytoene synthase family protein [Xanthobacteraceae bacterium]|nr:squalene/phytoene synthase family protein [Xanthobacteraceae bacterium]